jgi:hypothetical protein
MQKQNFMLEVLWGLSECLAEELKRITEALGLVLKSSSLLCMTIKIE